MNKPNSSLPAVISLTLTFLLGITFIAGAIFGGKFSQPIDPLSRVSFGLVGIFFVIMVIVISNEIINHRIDSAFKIISSDASETEEAMECLHTDENYM